MTHSAETFEFSHERADEIQAYWAGRLQVEASVFARGETVLQTDAGVAAGRVELFRQGSTMVVRVGSGSPLPARLVQEGAFACAAWGAREMLEHPAMPAAELARRELVWYLPAKARLEVLPGTRPLSADDAGAFEALQLACTPEERKVADVQRGHPGAHGRWCGEELVAVASLIHMGEAVSDVGMLVHPARRRRGHGRSVTAAACAFAREQGRIPQYCAAEWNTASIRLARSLGFRAYGVVESVRFV